MTKRRRMRLAEEQAAADAAEREAAAEERKKRREKLVAELGGIDAVNKAIVDNLNEDVEKDVFGSTDEAFPQEPHDQPDEPDPAPAAERQDDLGDEQVLGDSQVSGDGQELAGETEVKAITGSILRSHQHIPCNDDGESIVDKFLSPIGPIGVFLTSEPRSFQSPPANPDAVICREDEDLSGDQNETEFEEEE